MRTGGAAGHYHGAMSTGRYSTRTETLDEHTARLTVTGPDGPLSWRGLLAGLRADSDLADALGAGLAELPFTAFRWETPAMTTGRLDTPFECVAVDDPALDVRPDPSPFAEHLRDDRPVVRFPNLGGDAVMIVPCRQTGEWAYAHFAVFLRRAPKAQQQALWRAVAGVMEEMMGERAVWLSTAGAGVAWLHVRIDERPKYYTHAPYRKTPAGGA